MASLGGTASTPQSVLRLKVISMGPAGCGKSCLIKRYCEKRFVTKYIVTIGVDYGVKRVCLGPHDVRVNFWDLSGQPEFFEIRNEFYKDAQGAILVYDGGSRRSYEELGCWVDEAGKYGARDIPVIVCCNKLDKGKRLVSENEGRAWARARGYMHIDTSASTGQNVDHVFESLFKAAVSYSERIDSTC